jgi:hypothetical protein
MSVRVDVASGDIMMHSPSEEQPSTSSVGQDYDRIGDGGLNTIEESESVLVAIVALPSSDHDLHNLHSSVVPIFDPAVTVTRLMLM